MHQMFLNLLNKKNQFLLSFIFFSCASVKAPQGGLIDSVPPKLDSTNPEILTNLNQGQKITLSFNEYIKEESLKNSIELFPAFRFSPAILINPLFGLINETFITLILT